MDAAVAGQRPGDGLARVAVQRAALAGRPQQPLLVGLPVHGDQVLAEFGEQPDGHRPAADVRPGAALGGDGTADQQGAVVEFGAGLDGAQGRRGVGGQFEPALDHRPAGAAAYQARVGAAAEQQAEAGHHHGLAGAGLAGDDGEPRCQFDHGVLDDTKISYPHLVQHGDDLTRFRPRRATSGNPAPSSSSVPGLVRRLPRCSLRHRAQPQEVLRERADGQRVGDGADAGGAAEQDADDQHGQLDAGADQAQ